MTRTVDRPLRTTVLVLGWLSLLTTISCGAPDTPNTPVAQDPDWGPNANALPVLDLVFESKTLDTSPISPNVTVAIERNGSVFMSTDNSDAGKFTLIDTTGVRQLTFGKTGSGPGEVRGAGPIGTVAGGVAVFDMRQLKVVLFDSTGAPLRDIRRPGTPLMFPKLILNDSTALVGVPGPKGENLPAMMNLANGKTTNMVPASDSFLATFTGPEPMNPPPTLGRWLGGIIIADSRDYRLAFYDWEGNFLRVIKHSAERPIRTLAEANAMLTALNNNPARRPLTGAALNRERDRL